MVNSLRAVFSPASIAVVGASRTPGTIGYQIVANLLRHGFQGPVYPVNPRATSIHSVPAYPSVRAIPGPVDLAVVTVPKELALTVAEECGEKGVQALVVITAGFREVGGEGVERERRLVEIVRRYGMRLVGPNCMGVLNTDPAVSMNATFAPTMPPPGGISFLSQSGAMGVTVLDYAAEYGIGIHNFISVGNKPDVSGNDLLEAWEQDERTRVVLMYMESFGNPQRFTQLARRITKLKPVVVVKSGRSAAGARAASSHTGALAGTDVAIDALLAQCGVIRVDSVEALFDLAMAFEDLPVPTGNRVVIVTNSGGPGIIIADFCEAGGLEVVELAPETQARLRQALAAEASVRNPVDMIAGATPDTYRVALDAVLADPNVDAAIAAFVPPLGIKQAEVAQAIVDVRRARPQKPILAVLMGREGLPQGRAELREAGVPAYIFPESAARSLSAMVRYRRWLERPEGCVRTFGEVNRAGVTDIIVEHAERGQEMLSGVAALEVLSAYGIQTVGYRAVQSPEEAAAEAERQGFPVVLKILSPDIVHKTDVGGVLVDLRSPQEVREGFTSMMAHVRAVRPDAEILGVLVQRYARGGRETIVGMTWDPKFGPVLMFGLGGIYVEALQDVVFRIQPVSDLDALDMVRSIRGHKLLEGIRGDPPADIAALAESIERVGQLVGEHPAIRELDINPLLATEHGVLAVDARVRVDLAAVRALLASAQAAPAAATT
jgi:acetyl coenzyme A synthetase (ADP forming)-like protein